MNLHPWRQIRALEEDLALAAEDNDRLSDEHLYQEKRIRRLEEEIRRLRSRMRTLHPHDPEWMRAPVEVSDYEPAPYRPYVVPPIGEAT